MVRTPGNSDGVAFPQPRVAGAARYPGYAAPTNVATLKELRLAVGVTRTRTIGTKWVGKYYQIEYNAFG